MASQYVKAGCGKIELEVQTASEDLPHGGTLVYMTLYGSDETYKGMAVLTYEEAWVLSMELMEKSNLAHRHLTRAISMNPVG